MEDQELDVVREEEVQEERSHLSLRLEEAFV